MFDNSFAPVVPLGSGGFADPFFLPSSESMPDNLETALDLCLFLYHMCEPYRAASSQVARYFITDFDYPGLDGDTSEKRNLDTLLHETLKLPLFLGEVGDEFACYGNVFVRIHFPTDRFLIHPRTGHYYALDFFGDDLLYHYRTMQYEVPDPLEPLRRIRMHFVDQVSLDASRIRLRRINPRYVTIQHCLISGNSRFVYRFEPAILDDVRRGRLWVVNEMPLSMLRSIAKDQDFLFDDDAVYHFKAPTISGVSNYGWGLPGTIANYRNLHQLQVYRAMDEAVGRDYLQPFRIFSIPHAEAKDLVNSFNNQRWAYEIRKAIRVRRADKVAMHAFPFPVEYQEFGANGKNLTPKDLIEVQKRSLLEGMSFPLDLFSGNLQFLQVPTAMRLFESSFLHIYSGFNALTSWVSKRVQRYLRQPIMETRLQRPTLADSIERKQMLVQLTAMGEISRETGYDSLGIDDVVAELRKRMDEDAQLEREKFRMQSQLQKEIETGVLRNPQQDGSAPAGEVPGVVNQTPMDVVGNADQLASYWLGIPSDGERSRAMQAVRAQDQTLYAMAKQKMEELRRQGASQGRQQVAQAAQQGGGV